MPENYFTGTLRANTNFCPSALTLFHCVGFPGSGPWSLNSNFGAEAWNAGMEQRLGIRPKNDVEGCLQDIHWAVGSFGYFPSYALGAVIAAQLYESLRVELPALDEQLAHGEFSGLFGWLRTHVHGLGAKVPVQELLKNATGKPLSAASFVRYVEAKYLETVASSEAA